jgi:Uma2 family endonuclease
MSATGERAEPRLTVAEFLAYDDGTGTRYELVDGLLVAMKPPAPRHMEICENLGRALERQVRPPCRVYRAALGVALAETGRDWREPDLIVTCTRPEGGVYAAPRLVVEVLSPSTEKDDRTTKLTSTSASRAWRPSSSSGTTSAACGCGCVVTEAGWTRT